MNNNNNNSDDGIKQTLFDRYMDLSYKVTNLKKEYEKELEGLIQNVQDTKDTEYELSRYFLGKYDRLIRVVKDLEELLK